MGTTELVSLGIDIEEQLQILRLAALALDDSGFGG
jgi:hypothetical protein